MDSACLGGGYVFACVCLWWWGVMVVAVDDVSCGFGWLRMCRRCVWVGVVVTGGVGELQKLPPLGPAVLVST